MRYVFRTDCTADNVRALNMISELGLDMSMGRLSEKTKHYCIGFESDKPLQELRYLIRGIQVSKEEYIGLHRVWQTLAVGIEPNEEYWKSYAC